MAWPHMTDHRCIDGFAERLRVGRLGGVKLSVLELQPPLAGDQGHGRLCEVADSARSIA